MRDLPFVQVYDVSLVRLRDAVESQFRALEAETSTTPPLELRRKLCDIVHFLSGAVCQWYTSILFLCEHATKGPGLERSALLAQVEVERRRVELEIAGRTERINRMKR